jgi:tricorn protease
MTYFRSLSAALLLLALSAPSPAQEPIRFARTPDISPDGRLVAFSYLGDIWVVETIGGVARPVTMHEAHDIAPVFSPDGRWIAFSSNRHGSYDVFVVSAQGGRPRRLTFDSASDMVSGWSPDCKSILFTSDRSTEFPEHLGLYSVPVEGGRVRKVMPGDARDGVYSPKGDQIAYVRGPGTWYRKGYRGSSNDDIWLCNADGNNHRPLTTFNGEDLAPMWGADGRTLYYVSEVFGTPANIVRQRLAVPAGSSAAKPEPLTSHKDDGVRRARISGNGAWIVYECGADLWVVPTAGGPPRKLAIEVHADDKTNPERTVTYTSGASEFALAANEKHIAFVVHGELFRMPISGGKATRLTDSPANDHGVVWEPHGKGLLFASDRGGYEDLYFLEADDPEHKEFVQASRFKVRQLTHTPEAEIGASFSPDGRRIAFIRAGRLWTMNPDGSEAKQLVAEPQVFDYEWSPDSKYVVYARQDGHFASDLYIIPAAGGPTHNVTRYATYNGGVTWSLRGKKLAFISERQRGESRLFVLPLEKPAATGAPASGEIDWEDIHLRAVQAAPLHADEGAISSDGNKVAFRGVVQGSEDLWLASTTGSQLSRLTTGNQRPRQIQWSRIFPDLIYYLDGGGNVRTARGGASLSSELFRLGSSSGSDGNRITFSAKMTLRRDEDFGEMFEQSWRALAEEFYDPLYHGIEWTAVREKYRPLVKHVALREDFYSLVSLMIGELNASHLGIQGMQRPPEETTADLGLLFDESYAGPGLRVAEVLKRGPADRRGLALKAGDIITSIDGTQLDGHTSLSKLLNAKAGESVVLQVASPPKTPGSLGPVHRVEVQPVSREQVHELMYERWVEQNARRVAELSAGKLGYIHIPSMDDAGLDRFVRSLYSDNYDKEAIVLDVRYNGGGFAHDQVLNYLGGREHTIFRQRDGGQGMVLRSFDRKWTKPLVLLINNRSYSDAEIFPHAFRTLGLGKLVGQPTGAHVIGTSSVRLIDGSRFRIPRIGVYTMAGTDMEKEGVVPDVSVIASPDQLAKGEDPQLDKAVEVLQKDVVAWQHDHPAGKLQPDTGKTSAAVPTTSRK